MARKTLEQNIREGILTITNVATILNVSQITVRKWITLKKLPDTVRLPGSKEYRISANDVLRLWRNSNATAPQRLIEAARNYRIGTGLEPAEPTEEKSDGLENVIIL